MKVYTSYYWAYQNDKLPKDLFPIGISRTQPKELNLPKLESLMPSWYILNAWQKSNKDKQAEDVYTASFSKQLDKINAKDIWSQLEQMSGGKDVVLLCYEGKGKFCHRHLVADWFTRENYKVTEYNQDVNQLTFDSILENNNERAVGDMPNKENNNRESVIEKVDKNKQAIDNSFSSKLYNAKKKVRDQYETKDDKHLVSVLYVEPGKFPKTVKIEPTEEALKKLLNGDFELAYDANLLRATNAEASIFVDENGKINNRPGNRTLWDKDNITDVVCGPMVVVGHNIIDSGDYFGEMSKDTLNYCEKYFHSPEKIEYGDVGNGRNGVTSEPLSKEYNVKDSMKKNQQNSDPSGRD